MKKRMEVLMGMLLLMMVAAIVNYSEPITSQEVESVHKYTVVLDAGHGGKDPGKVGVNDALEKDINLAIVFMLKDFLEANDVAVYLTREDDGGLYSLGDNNKKMADLKARCALIETVNPDLVISIHQNSFQDEAVRGGQVFYYKSSEKGRQLAEIIQKKFTSLTGDEYARSAKTNDNYYLLLNVAAPIVIVECGFLSNKEEATLLTQTEYQEKVAWTVHMGVMEYLNNLE